MKYPSAKHRFLRLIPVFWLTAHCRHSSVVEHFIGNEEVSGSSPDGGSSFSFDILRFLL